jgi:hypothetical protein
MGRREARRLAAAVTMAAAVSAAVPAAAPARAAAPGVVYGGATSTGWPVVVELNKKHRKVVRAATAVRLQCTSGGAPTVSDAYAGLKISKNGRFSSSFGPETQRNDDGTTTDFQGSIAGKLNKAQTKITGTWSLTATDHDANGAVTDTCSATDVSWHAKQ